MGFKITPGVKIKQATIPDGLLAPWFIILSYAYYELDEGVMMDDHEFDAMAKRMAGTNGWRKHRHAGLIDDDMLAAGTGSGLVYPGIAKGAARAALAEWHGRGRKTRKRAYRKARS